MTAGPMFFTDQYMPAVEALRSHFEAENAHIMADAKAALRAAVRKSWCDLFGIGAMQTEDEDGAGGRIRLTFPTGWTEDQVLAFAEHCYEIDLSRRYGGPGKYFQDSFISTDGERYWLVSTWGLDI